VSIKHFSDPIISVYDASAKVPSGILSGNINQYGNFDQCLSVNEPSNLFKGKYCLAYFQLKIPDDDVLVQNLKKEAHKFEHITNEIDDVIFAYIISYNPVVFG
jgi:hypothetical protein